MKLSAVGIDRSINAVSSVERGKYEEKPSDAFNALRILRSLWISKIAELLPVSFDRLDRTDNPISDLSFHHKVLQLLQFILYNVSNYLFPTFFDLFSTKVFAFFFT